MFVPYMQEYTLLEYVVFLKVSILIFVLETFKYFSLKLDPLVIFIVMYVPFNITIRSLSLAPHLV